MVSACFQNRKKGNCFGKLLTRVVDDLSKRGDEYERIGIRDIPVK